MTIWDSIFQQYTNLFTWYYGHNLDGAINGMMIVCGVIAFAVSSAYAMRQLVREHKLPIDFIGIIMAFLVMGVLVSLLLPVILVIIPLIILGVMVGGTYVLCEQAYLSLKKRREFRALQKEVHGAMTKPILNRSEATEIILPLHLDLNTDTGEVIPIVQDDIDWVSPTPDTRMAQ